MVRPFAHRNSTAIGKEELASYYGTFLTVDALHYKVRHTKGITVKRGNVGQTIC